MSLQIGESTYLIYPDSIDSQSIIDIMAGNKIPEPILNLKTPINKERCSECGYTSREYKTSEDVRDIHIHLLCEMRKRSLSMGWNQNLGANSSLRILPTDILGIILQSCKYDTQYIWIKVLEDGETVFFDKEDIDRIFDSLDFPRYKVIESLVKNGGHFTRDIMRTFGL